MFKLMLILVIPITCALISTVSASIPSLEAVPNTTGSPYTLNLKQYFPSALAERAARATLTSNVDAFLKVSSTALSNPQDLFHWLRSYEALTKSINRHYYYVYLLSEEDVGDHQDATATDTLDAMSDQLDDKVQRMLASLGTTKLHQFIGGFLLLKPYKYFIDSTLVNAHHAYKNEQAIDLLAQPALTTLGSAYITLRRKALSSFAEATPHTAETSFNAQWVPFNRDQDAFAAILLPIAVIQNGAAKLQGFANAPAAAYFQKSISANAVDEILTLLQKSTAYHQFQFVIASATAKRLNILSDKLQTWDLDQVDTYKQKPTPIGDAIPLILAAEKPMGSPYADQYERLFDPANGRVEICQSARCDHSGFSIGYAGMTSGLYFGSYDGSLNSMRAVAHEAGHAVHREFMAKNQPLAIYNTGPHFMFESFAIFNEFLFLHHMYAIASTPAARAYYLHQFLNDEIFQVYGSAEETDLNQSIYSGVEAGTLHSAADLDALTQRVFSRYVSAPAFNPAMEVYWARDRLFYTDPLYDVNYLFAGLLALDYFRQFENNPTEFSRHYVELLKNGFTDSPQALLQKFLSIDLDNSQGLVRNANTMIEQQTTILAGLYGICPSNVPACKKP